MKITLTATALLAFALAGCATEGQEQYAKADCKITTATTRSSAGVAPNASELEKRHAEMGLATSDVRFRNLSRYGYVNNTIEDALRDCY